jgi:hypothetical protein
MREILYLLAVGAIAGIIFAVTHSIFIKSIWNLAIKKHSAVPWLNTFSTGLLTLIMIVAISLWRDHNQVSRDMQSLLFLGYLIVVVPYVVCFIIKVIRIK